MSGDILAGDAFVLPFRDGIFDVVIADPPYELPGRGRAGRGKNGVSTRPYVPFRGREWWEEAWRVLSEQGRLYVFCAVTELPSWLAPCQGRPRPTDVLAWHAPNAAAIAGKYRKSIKKRAYTWRPIVEWSKPGTLPIKKVDGRSSGNSLAHSLVTYPMREALPWPNQIPLAVARWLLAPLGARTVLDLFAGTGTTRIAALEMGLSVVSVEMSREAIAIARTRAGSYRLPAQDLAEQ
jgi:DNA modification methylase